MNVREVTIGRTKYRGPMCSNSALMPWKINVYRWSGKMSPSGSGCRIGMSWQRWNLYPSEEAADAAMRALERSATEPTP